MTSRPKYNQYLTSNRRQVPAGPSSFVGKANESLVVLLFNCRQSAHIVKSGYRSGVESIKRF